MSLADTMDVRVHRDETAPATPDGPFAFFAEFLARASVFDHRVPPCPLHLQQPERLAAA